jgi:hypothetical protein
MSEIAKLLRIASLATKEIVTQEVRVNAEITGEVFTSALTLGHTRKKLIFYNKIDAGSGEVYFGPEGVNRDSGEGMIIKKGDYCEVAISDDLDLYLVADAANEGPLQVVELS